MRTSSWRKQRPLNFYNPKPHLYKYCLEDYSFEQGAILRTIFHLRSRNRKSTANFKIVRMTTFKYTLPTNQSSSESPYSTELSNELTRNCNVQQGGWGGQIFSEEPLHTESLSLSPLAAVHIPGPRWSYAACAWIIHWHSSPDRLVHGGPWEEAAHASHLTAADSPGQERCSAVHVWPCSAGLSCCCQQTMTPWHIDQT